jgi:hypothetical protein
MKPYRRALAIVAVNLAVLAVGIGILELRFGAWLNPLRLNRLNLVKARTLTFDVSGLYEGPSPLITYSRDQYGLRGTYGSDPARIDLLTVGGSTTDQRYLADGATWQDVLQEQFAAIGRPLMVANAGVDGQSTFGHIKNFDWWFPYIPHLKPKYILYNVGLNDFYVDVSPSPYDDLVRPSLVATMKDNSALWHLVRTASGAYQAARVLKIGHRRIDFEAVQWTNEPLQDGYTFIAPRLDGYAARLRILVDRTRRLGSTPIFVSQPSRHFRRTPQGIQGRAELTPYAGRQINGVDRYYMMRLFIQVMEAVCRERNAAFIDLAADTDWTDHDFYDFNHTTPAGARKLGLRLFAKLRPIVGVAETSAVPVANQPVPVFRAAGEEDPGRMLRAPSR